MLFRSLAELNFRLLNPRHLQVLRLKMAGKSYQEIGRLVGRADDPSIPVTGERARQILCRTLRVIRHPKVQKYLYGRK